MISDPLLQRFAVALAIGLLIGLERGWQFREEAEGERTAGLRTYTLSSLLGAICAALATYTSPIFLGLAFVAFAGGFSAFAWLEAQAERNFSVTGVVAALIAFALGAYAVLGNLQIAVAIAVTVTLILALKQPLHAWLRQLTWPEIRSILILLAMTFLLLPLLPNRTVDPWDAINPAAIWLLVIILGGISFVGYFAIRIMGSEAGVAMVALAGGLASSTATTLTLSRLAKRSPSASTMIAGGILLSGSVMVVRMLVIASAINTALLVPLAWTLGTAGLVLVSGAAFLLLGRSSQSAHPDLQLKNPLDLRAAFQLAALVAIISFLAKIVTTYVGETGLNVLAALSGIADVDAITLSFSRLSQGSIGLQAAAIGMGIAAAVNTVVKAGMTFALGTRQAGWIVGAISAAAIAAGGAAYAFFV
ncbi:MgtC/SapB family protein [Microvirga sp. 2MCAF38]|uniref:MgtC/SapB family protein n=1 Tax=Microvirga sp. 2MCAF38 TaxID=3232989 RepID=UPI003F949D75